MSSRWRAVATIGLGVLGGSCLSHNLRSSYAEEFSCDSDHITVEDLGLNRYRVMGCNRTVYYVCSGACAIDHIADDAPPPAAAPARKTAVAGAARKGTLGDAHLEKSKAGASLVSLDVRLDPDTLLKLRGLSDGDKPVTLQIAHLGDGDAPKDCELAAMINGQRIALPRTRRSQLAGEATDGRTLATEQTELAPQLLRELGGAQQFALKDCQSRWSLSQPALEQVRHFVELYEQEKAWQRPASEGGTGGLLAPASGWPAWSVTATPPAPVTAGPLLDAPLLFKILSPSVFKVVARTTTGTMQGSAVAVTSSELLTNCHVLEGAQTVKLLQGKVTRVAQIARANPAADRCVLAVPEPNLTPIRGVRDFDGLQIGEPLYTLGSPSGLELSLASGILSGKREEDKTSYVQTTAPISPGSSGGGLFDARGNLIGITTLVLAGREHLNQSLNFAIPADAFWQP